VSNRSSGVQKLKPGLYGLSNHLLDTSWPKIRNAKAAMNRLLKPGEPPDVEQLFAMLEDRTIAPDTDLPDTGVGLELERALSPIFIESADYGTRSSSVVTIDDDGAVAFWERTYGFDSSGQMASETRCVEFVVG